MIVVAGCQAAGGVDFNQMLKRSLKVSSMEGKQSIEFQLLMKDGTGQSEDPSVEAVIALVKHMKLELTDIKVKDQLNASYKGLLSLGETHIGFGLRTSGDLTVLELEGAKRPIEIKLTNGSLDGLLGTAGLPVSSDAASAQSSEDVQAQLKEIGYALIDHVGGYAIDNMPNPTRMSVTPVTQTVNGESMPLMQVHAEINGKELWTWVGSYMDALIADKDGLSAMLTAVVDLLADKEELWASLDTENPFADLPEGVTKEAFIQEGVSTFIDELSKARAEMKTAEKDNAAEINGFFNEGSYIKADLFVDTKLEIRKQNVELLFKPEMSEKTNSELSDGLGLNRQMPELLGFSIKLSKESWNIDGSVVPEAPKETPGALTVERMMDLENYQILREFDPKSDIYGLLKNNFQLGRQSFTLYPLYEEEPPIVTPDGVTLIPLRSTAAELGAEITYNNVSKIIGIYDDATGTSIEMKSGSKAVIVNGTAVKWSYPLTRLNGGTLYVPARDLIGALGGMVKWQGSSDNRTFIIEREVE
jgi:hypothetical protein